MNKIESRHRLIRSIISEKKIRTQQELQESLEANGIVVTQSTLSRDVKSLNLVKIMKAILPIMPSTALPLPVGKNACDFTWRMPCSCCVQSSIKSLSKLCQV